MPAAKPLKWATSETDAALIARIVKRAKDGFPSAAINRRELCMDITAVHLNGCPLDLEKLLAAPDFDFVHDVFGIRNHINHTTGKLENLFEPRCAKREGVR